MLLSVLSALGSAGICSQPLAEYPGFADEITKLSDLCPFPEPSSSTAYRRNRRRCSTMFNYLSTLFGGCSMYYIRYESLLKNGSHQILELLEFKARRFSWHI
ncbi:hypothetical protein F5879DRAFT_970717 [Lentinula edodes]|nr:hypothetical protein F5879DRAFT_970717 [Lentinula edodes]